MEKTFDKAIKYLIDLTALLILVLIITLCGMTIDTYADEIRGSQPLAGASVVLEKYYDSNTENISTYLERRLDKLNTIRKEYEILARITEAEATDGTIEQKMNVISCILARVESKKFPNSIEEVVFQNRNGIYQFSPISDKRYYKVKITESTYEAIELVSRYGMTHSSLYFCTPTCKSAQKGGFHDGLSFDFCDGMHNYYESMYKKEITNGADN